jgi:hypothetical protein
MLRSKRLRRSQLLNPIIAKSAASSCAKDAGVPTVDRSTDSGLSIAPILLVGAPAMTRPSPAPPVARILHHVAVLALFADVVLLVVAVALGGVDGSVGRAAGALVALVVIGNGLDGFWLPLFHRSSP